LTSDDGDSRRMVVSNWVGGRMAAAIHGKVYLHKVKSSV
jgi:hypothetical protein